jgi:hypothetical protein
VFTVRLKNEPGALGGLCARLGQNGIDIRALAAGAVGTFGCAVVSTNNDEAARDVLRKGRYHFVEGETFNVGVEDRPGALAEMAQRLSAAGVNIIGVVVLGRHQGKAELAITVDSIEDARRALATAPVRGALL